MAQMVFREQQPLLPIEPRAILLQKFSQQVFLKEFLSYPQRQRHLKRTVPRRSKGQISFQEPFEFKKWLVVKHDVVERLEFHACFGQTVIHGVPRETGVVLLTRETFFLRRRHYLTVANQSRGAIVIESRNA